MKNACKMTIKQVPRPRRHHRKPKQQNAAVQMMMMTWTWLPVLVLCASSGWCGCMDAWRHAGVMAEWPRRQQFIWMVCTSGGGQEVRGSWVSGFGDPQLHLHIWPGHLTIVNTLVCCSARRQLSLWPVGEAILRYIQSCVC